MNRDLTPPEGLPSGAGPGDELKADRGPAVRPGLVAAVLVAAALIVFIVQNGSEVPVTWLFVEVNGPLWAVIVVAAAAGAVLSEIIGWVTGRSRRRKNRRKR